MIPLLSEESLSKVAKTLYEFDSERRGYMLKWEEQGDDVQLGYLQHAEQAVRAVMGLYDIAFDEEH